LLSEFVTDYFSSAVPQCQSRRTKFGQSGFLAAANSPKVEEADLSKRFRNSLSAPELLLAALILMLTVGVARAQDPFEIQVYEYDLVPKGLWNLETHINYTGRGTKTFEGTFAPTNNQFHLTYELTHGITHNFEPAGYLVLAHRPGGGFEFVGWRLRPRVSLRRSLAETTMFRFKTIFGDRLQTRQTDNQFKELLLKASILNRMTHLGMPDSTRVVG
jgi:hypothetical protein